LGNVKCWAARVDILKGDVHDRGFTTVWRRTSTGMGWSQLVPSKSPHEDKKIALRDAMGGYQINSRGKPSLFEHFTGRNRMDKWW